MGDFYALLIGNADYEQLNDLETPIRDIRAVGALLEEKYGAVSYYVENGSRRGSSSFQGFGDKSSWERQCADFLRRSWENDRTQNEGYWLPVDAEPSDDFYWISNSYIKSKVREMGAKNILLIADSCFSGLLTRGLEMPVEDSTLLELRSFKIHQAGL